MRSSACRKNCGPLLGCVTLKAARRGPSFHSYHLLAGELDRLAAFRVPEISVSNGPRESSRLSFISHQARVFPLGTLSPSSARLYCRASGFVIAELAHRDRAGGFQPPYLFRKRGMRLETAATIPQNLARGSIAGRKTGDAATGDRRYADAIRRDSIGISCNLQLVFLL